MKQSHQRAVFLKQVEPTSKLETYIKNITLSSKSKTFKLH